MYMKGTLEGKLHLACACLELKFLHVYSKTSSKFEKVVTLRDLNSPTASGHTCFKVVLGHS